MLSVWLLGGHPGRADADLAALRTDLGALAAQVESLEGTLPLQLAELEARVATHAAKGGATDVRPALEALARDLEMLRDSLRFELTAVDAELVRIRSALQMVSGALGEGDATGPLSVDEEPRWVIRAADPDPGVRFSALVRLGRKRTDRSVRASRDRLGDLDAMVVWQAVRNLSVFRERLAAPEIAGLLEHEKSIVREVAFEALLRMGAPLDVEFDAVAAVDERAAAARRLREWADGLR